MEQAHGAQGERRSQPAGIQKKIHGEGGIWTVLEGKQNFDGIWKSGRWGDAGGDSQPCHLWGHGVEFIQKLGQHTPLLSFLLKRCAFSLTFGPKFDHALDDWQHFFTASIELRTKILLAISVNKECHWPSHYSYCPKVSQGSSQKGSQRIPFPF